MTPHEAAELFIEELTRAERKFPTFPTDPIHAAAIVNEEAGELVRAALQFTYEGETFIPVMKEAIQTAAMALRFILNVPTMRARPSEQVDRDRAGDAREQAKDGGQ